MRNNTRKQKDITANPSKYPQRYFKEKPCRNCKKSFKPKAPSHLFCSDYCKDFSYSDNYYRNTYNIGYQTVLDQLEKQNNLCLICSKVGFKMNKGIKHNLVVDHCHDSGRFRGLLCNNCNRGLGLFKDSTESLKRAIEYLEGATTIPYGSTLK